ncbi:hypothetical protein ACKWTF_011105 [Chironomus riparius]
MKFIYSVAFLCIVSVAIAHHDEEQQQARSYFGDAKYLFKTYQECASQDLSTCLKLKLYTVVDRIARSNSDLKIYDGVTFVSEKVDEEHSPPKSEQEVEASLPRSLDDKEKSLNQMIMDRLLSYFDNHTLKVKFPSADEMKRSINEARQKGGLGGNKGGSGGGKKNGHYIMIPLLLGSTLVPLAFGALALLAGKALIVSKLALALASIIGIKKLLSHSHHHESAHEG